MDALLAVISEAKTKNHHWEPRHVFWKGLYNRGLIDEAWIALSRDAIDIANYKLAMSNDPIYSMVSRQVAKGDKKETCLLIMRVGRFVVLEGSHDYRVHIFDQHDPRAPKFYEDEYDAHAMRSAVDDPNARIHDIYGNWKGWVERRLF